MTTENHIAATTTTVAGGKETDKRPRSIFELPGDFFDSCRLIPPGGKYSPATLQFQPNSDVDETLVSTRREKIDEVNDDDSTISSNSNSKNRWTCNICKSEFESLIDQRSHFKSDLHRFNVKLSLAGKNIMKEEDFDSLASDSFSNDFDVSSISGSEDEDDRGSHVGSSVREALVQSIKQKIFVRLLSGDRISLWKCLLLKDSQTVSCENDQFVVNEGNSIVPCLREVDVINKLKVLIHEPRDGTHFSVMLLARGGHFAGCVFDGNTVVAHKTFHRYVVRAKAGKKQSSKDASGRSIHSAGASLRRYNEIALKKDIQDLLASWKPYFDAASCVFIQAPSSNRQLFYNGDKPLFSNEYCDVRNIPFTVRRPTFKEARRIYSQLTQAAFEVDEEALPDLKQLELNESSISTANLTEGVIRDEVRISKGDEASESIKISDEQSTSGDSDMEVIHRTTPLHEAAKCANVEKVLELLEQGLDPTIKDERGKTPYMVATEKEVRNTFRRFMASNLEKWDWHAANVPSPLTKEMEESQAAKQAEKDAKRKAKAKELKKLRKAREKKAQAEIVQPQGIATVLESKSAASPSVVRSFQSGIAGRLSKEEELKRKQAEERERRAAAAELRMKLAASAQETNMSASSSTSQSKNGISTDIVCSCCSASLVGKVPFHRYNYKYCSTTCMSVHREFLEDG